MQHYPACKYLIDIQCILVRRASLHAIANDVNAFEPFWYDQLIHPDSLTYTSHRSAQYDESSMGTLGSVISSGR